METRYAVCAACNDEPEEYHVYADGDTDIIVGHYMVHRNYMTTGLKSLEIAKSCMANSGFALDRALAIKDGKARNVTPPTTIGATRASDVHGQPKAARPEFAKPQSEAKLTPTEWRILEALTNDEVILAKSFDYVKIISLSERHEKLFPIRHNNYRTLLLAGLLDKLPGYTRGSGRTNFTISDRGLATLAAREGKGK